MIYGFTALGARRIIAIYFENKDDNRFWLGVFEDLKERNLQNIMFLVTPQNNKKILTTYGNGSTMVFVDYRENL